MAETNINLYFHDRQESGTPSSPLDENKPNVNDPTQPKGDNSKKAIGSAIALKVIKTATAQAASRAGQIYGSSQLQDTINSIGTLVGYGTAIAVNPIMGLSMLAVNVGINVLDYYIGKKDEERTLSVIKARASSSLNRSR